VVLGVTLLATSLSTFFVGAEMNVLAIFTHPTALGCVSWPCWLMLGGWIAGMVVAVIIVLKCACCAVGVAAAASGLDIPLVEKL
jgi:hypothetical protein